MLPIVRQKPFDNVMLHYNEDGRLCNHPKSEKEVCKGEEVSHSLEQTLWPDHAVMNTPGAELASKLVVKESDLIVRKGHNCEVERNTISVQTLCIAFINVLSSYRLTPTLPFMTMEALQ